MMTVRSDDWKWALETFVQALKGGLVHRAMFDDVSMQLLGARQNARRFQQGWARDIERLTTVLLRMGASEDAVQDPIGAAINILEAYHEAFGPWPGQPVQVSGGNSKREGGPWPTR